MPSSKAASACTGVCMAKMTPFRSYMVTVTAAAETAILGTLQMKGGVITYIMVRLVKGSNQACRSASRCALLTPSHPETCVSPHSGSHMCLQPAIHRTRKAAMAQHYRESC